ncbi:MAG: geranylgeranylglyceryl/heptaprenylglyceryl phosphate synthase [candidate division Zixibacteria bacterium]|nr:geranylgeranylglyceryl/heptaprenylglyceryl phosphate synthase [candidate division Zixibacteria bacterium]
MNTYQKLLDIKDKKGSGFLVLLDPDRHSREEMLKLVEKYQSSGADAFLVGSSLLLSDSFDQTLSAIKKVSQIPVIIFPGNSHQISAHADAILYLSLISGRNPEFLIGEHVKSAGIINEIRLEPISTGYMVIDSGKMTSVLFMSNTRPIPADKPEIAVAHALAAQFLGMKLIYLEAGSGAASPVPNRVIQDVKKMINIPVIVGGGIRDSKIAAEKVASGADFIVIGNALEENASPDRIREFARAVHWREQ